MILDPPCLTLSIIRYQSRAKWTNPGNGVAPFPTPQCSSRLKGNLRITLDYGHQLIYICIYIVFPTCLQKKAISIRYEYLNVHALFLRPSISSQVLPYVWQINWRSFPLTLPILNSVHHHMTFKTIAEPHTLSQN